MTNVINGDGTIDQDILVNDAFYLRGRRPPRVLLEVLSFLRSFNLLFTEELIITGERNKKRGVWGNSIVGVHSIVIKIVEAFLTFH